MNSTTIAFDKLIYKRGIIPNLACAILIFIYSILFLIIKPEQILLALIVAAAISLGAEFLISPITNVILTKKITKDIQNWEQGLVNDEKSRTRLYQEIAEFPMKKAIQTFLFFFICAMMLALGYRFVPGLQFQWAVVIISFIGCVFGGYSAGILAQSYSEDICSIYAKKLVKEGIDRSLIAENKSFGMSLALRCVIYLIVPLLYITVVTYMMAQQYFARYIVTDADRFSILSMMALRSSRQRVFTSISSSFINNVRFIVFRCSNTIFITFHPNAFYRTIIRKFG